MAFTGQFLFERREHDARRGEVDAIRSERLRACMEGWLAAHDLKGVERPATASIEGVAADGTITIVGTVEVSLADFGIEPPSIPNVLTARDTALIEFQLFLEPT